MKLKERVQKNLTRYRWRLVGSGVFLTIFSTGIDYGIVPVVQNYIDAPTLSKGVSQLQYMPGFRSPQFNMSQYLHNQVYVIPAFLVILLIQFGLVVLKRPRGYRERSDVGSHGTARWASEKEIREKYQQNNYGLLIGGLENEKKEVEPLYFPYTQGIPSNQNILIHGPAGSGKSAGFVIPTLFSLADSGSEDSIVITDPKGELYEKTAKYMEQHGYRVKVFGFTDIADMFFRGESYNPIHFCKDMMEVQGLAHSLLTIDGSNEWTNMAQSFLSAVIGFLRFGFDKQYSTLINVNAMLTLDDDLYESTLGKMIREWFEQVKDDDDLHDIAHEIWQSWRKHDSVKAEGPRSSVRATINGAMTLFDNRKLARFLTKNTFDWRDFSEKEKTISYIIINDDPQYAPITRIFFMQFFQGIADIATENGGKLTRHLRFILDEFGNLGRITGAPGFMALSRGRNTSVCPVIQDYSQLMALYGRSGERGGESNIVKNNTVGTLVLGLAPDDDEGKARISRLLGNMTIEVDSQSQNDKGGENQSVSFTSRALMDIGELGQLQEDEYLFLGSGSYPIRGKKYMYFRNPRWKNVTQANIEEELPIKDIELCDIDTDYFYDLHHTEEAVK